MNVSDVVAHPVHEPSRLTFTDYKMTNVILTLRMLWV